MTRTARHIAVASIAALAAIAAIIAADFTAPASAQSDDLMLDSPGEEQPSGEQPSGRIVARRLRDGRTELGWQQRTNGAWGERILPRRRYFPAAPTIGRWYPSSAVSVEGIEIGHIEARKRRDGGIELAFTPTNGERFLPFENYIPSNVGVGSWRHTSEIAIDPALFLARRIAARFAPVILFEQDEDYFPVPVELMIRHSTLHYTRNGQARTRLSGTYRLSDLISHNGRDSYLDLADDVYKFPGERVVYARVAETYGANAGVLVQYWFFYLYNATGDPEYSHEGDWEGVQLWFAGLSPADLLTANVPMQIGYAAHESGWAYTQKVESCAAINAPLTLNVYVARNRHASYFGAGGGGFFSQLVQGRHGLDKSFDKQDQFQGNGAAWALQGVAVPDVEGEVGYELRMLPTDPNQSWLAWTGQWGDDRGPRGPAFKPHFWLPPVRNGWSQAEFECRAR